MLSKPQRKDDCGCGGGKYNCITKNTFNKWLVAELKRLDCGCGCKGEKGFKKKYGLVGGSVLADCPPGWRNDGLTCVSPCNPDEFDDGLTCRKKCPPGQIDDGLTCRNPITSSMNSCPPGSRDIAGTCWGPVRKDCVDDCFKHPAPGCRTYQCGRLRGLFGEDWGPRLCTDCNLRCGQTCWDVQGITKQLHERQLKVMGGEVFGQAIRGKEIRGRVDFNKLFQEMEKGLGDFFEGRIDLLAAFDPERNGVAAAFRKFGDDIKKVLEEVGDRIKKGFENMAAATKAAFEEFARNAERDFKQFGEDFVNKMKDPDFWVEAIGIMAMIGGVALSILVTAGTLGIGAPAAAGIMAAVAMVGPATKMIAAAARGEPIDVLDIAEIAIAGATAFVPGLTGTAQMVLKGTTMAASICITGVKFAQDWGVIPSTCIANCPPNPNPPYEGPIVPELPPKTPAPPGEKSDEEIMKLQPANTIKFRAGKNPDYISTDDWIKQYRLKHYGPDAVPEEPIGTEPNGAIADKNDQLIENLPEVDPDVEPIYIDEVVIPEPPDDIGPIGDVGDIGPIGDIGDIGPIGDVGDIGPIGDIGDIGPIGDVGDIGPIGDVGDIGPIGDVGDIGPIGDIGDLGAGKLRRRRRGGTKAEDFPILPLVQVGNTYSNPNGTLVTTLKANLDNVPLGKDGKPFDVDCYANNYPDLAKQFNNDKAKLTAWWTDIGHKDGQDPSCGNFVSAAVAAAKEKELLEARKVACTSSNAFWTGTACDFHRNADGTVNTAAEECRQNGSWWDGEAKPPFCNRYRNLDNNMKSEADGCKAFDNFWSGTTCEQNKNVDGSLKTEGDFCTGMNNYWDGRKCIVDKDKHGVAKSNERMCHDLDGFYSNGNCDLTHNTKAQGKDERHMRQVKNCGPPPLIKSVNELSREFENKGLDYFAAGREAHRIYMNSLEEARKMSECQGPYPKNHKEMEEYLVSKKGKFKKQYEDLERDIIAKAFQNGARVFKDKNNQYAIGELVSPTSYFWFGSPPELHARHPELNLDLAPILDSSLMQQTTMPPKEKIVDPVCYAKNWPDLATFYKVDMNNITEKNKQDLIEHYNLYGKNEGRSAACVGGSGKPGKSLTLYWADWCPHCHTLLPIWKKLGKEYKGIQIQALEEKQTKFKVDGFPTIMYRDGSRMEKYEGPRTKAALVNFLKNKL